MSELSGLFLPLAVLLGLVAAVVLGVRIAREPVAGVYVFVFLSSITEMPQLPVIGDRLAAADFVMIFTILVAALKGQLFKGPPRGLRLIDTLGLLFIVLATVSSLLALMYGGDSVRVFLFLIIYIYGYLCFRLIIRLVDNPERFYRVCLWWAAGAVLVIVVGFLAATGIYKPEWTYDPIIMRINSTMKMSGQVSSYLAPAIFILFYLASTRSVSVLKQLAALGLIAAGSVVLIGTGSRISFVILLFVLLYGWFVIKTSSGIVVRSSLLTLSVIAGGIIFVGYAISVWTNTSEEYGLTTTSPFERAIKIFSETSREADSSVEEWGGSRYSEISLALDALDNHLFLGTGSGMFGIKYHSNEIHNTYVSILAENGLLAFMVFMLWWGMIVFSVYRAIRISRGSDRLMLRLIFGALLAISIYQFTTNGMRQRPFWFVPAISIAAVTMVRRKSQAERSDLLTNSPVQFTQGAIR